MGCGASKDVQKPSTPSDESQGTALSGSGSAVALALNGNTLSAAEESAGAALATAATDRAALDALKDPHEEIREAVGCADTKTASDATEKTDKSTDSKSSKSSNSSNIGGASVYGTSGCMYMSFSAGCNARGARSAHALAGLLEQVKFAAHKRDYLVMSRDHKPKELFLRCHYVTLVLVKQVN
jgi:hypothetical protein